MVVNNDIEIEIINPGETDPIVIEPDSWSLKRYRDANRASEFNFKCSRTIPVEKFARINVLEGGSIRFLGYAKVSQLSWPARRDISCKGLEELLWHRYTHRWSFNGDGCRFEHQFMSDAPNQTADEYGILKNSGMLFIANSRVPSYFPTGLGNYIYRYDDWGLNSVIGSKEIYFCGHNMPRAASYSNLEGADPGAYSNTDDLFVRANVNGFGLAGMQSSIDALNAFDTGVRSGDIDDGDEEITSSTVFSYNRIGDFLVNFAECFSRSVLWEYNNDRFCYANALYEPDYSEFELCEGEIDDFNVKNANEIKPHALIGLGIGSVDAIGAHCACDPSYQGIWYMDLYQVPDNRGWHDTEVDSETLELTRTGPIFPIVDAEYARRIEDDIYEITTSRWPHRPNPWDRVNLAMEMEAVRALSVASVKIDSKKKLVIELGGRKSELMDVWNAKSALENVYLYNYMKEVKTALQYSGAIQMGDDVHGWCTGVTFSLTVPSSVSLADKSHRVTLDLTITSDVEPVTAKVSVAVNGNRNRFCEMPHYVLNTAITNLDITSLVNYGSASTFVVQLQMRGDWPTHTGCTTHPAATLNAAVRMWKRIPLRTDE